MNDNNGNTITYGGGNGSSNDTFETNTRQQQHKMLHLLLMVFPFQSINEIDDVIDGATLSLVNTTSSPAIVSVSTSKDKVL